MRVLHVTPYYPPTWAYGGIPRVVGGLARAQAALGVDVNVWTTDAYDATRRFDGPERRVEAGVTVWTTPNLSNRLAWAHQLFLPQGAPPLAGVDLVHLHSHRHLLNYKAAKAAQALGLPLVMTPNGSLLRHERKQLLKALWDPLVDGDLPARADAVLATSRAEVRQCLEAGLPAARVFQVPNGLDLGEFERLPPRGRFRARLGLGPDVPLVSYLGQVSPRKGVDHLVAAFAEGGLNAELVVAGPARGMALPKTVRTTGTLSGAERLELLVDTDVLAYPSTAEVFGLVPFEGLLCGAPVVVGDDCGCGELVAEAGAGRLVPHGDVAALRDALAGLLANRRLSGEMVERGRRYIREKLDFGVVAQRTVEIYEQVLGARRAGRGAH